MITEIVILAMIAVFLGLRLYSVLGRRAEHEEESVPQRFESPDNAAANAPAQNNSPAVIPRPSQLEGVMPAVERGVREIALVDRAVRILDPAGAFLDAFDPATIVDIAVRAFHSALS
ncbi:MAG: hypothetical protein AAFN04_15150, partial [Pseudomonadota bacterium]